MSPSPLEAEVEQLWIDEAERRLEDYRSGRSTGIYAEEVFREAEGLARIRDPAAVTAVSPPAGGGRAGG